MMIACQFCGDKLFLLSLDAFFFFNGEINAYIVLPESLCQVPVVNYVFSKSGAGFLFYLILRRLGCSVMYFINQLKFSADSLAQNVTFLSNNNNKKSILIS